MTKLPANTLPLQDNWNRKILNLNWFMIILTTIVARINMFYTEQNLDYFWNYLIVGPLILMTGIMLLTELVYLLAPKRWQPYIILTAIVMLATTVATVHHRVVVVESLFVFPIFASGVYFDEKKVYFSMFISVLTYVGIQCFFEPYRLDFEIINFITFIGMMAAASSITIQIMRRGSRILTHLNELMVNSMMMEQAAKTDGLTQLNNQATFHLYLKQLMEQREMDCQPVQLAIIDIDHFKTVNDDYGHQVGDIVLRHVAQQIKETVSLHDFVARAGGEEFVVVFTHKTMKQTYRLVEQIRLNIAKMDIEELKGRRITVSIGLAEACEGMNKDSLFEQADAYLYNAKRNGRNQTITVEKQQETQSE
ncbi:GGDEF domain-containing protein [Brevibacillus dissolubilis]|uniref:GGDEF domain-containing protein n=1 Tax=Brevibacillus dissolubilis TaxID=1844116 RepID=UPI00111622C3|nr:GGDEF domain-containing protein [Brevibacillus dissolubilis]